MLSPRLTQILFALGGGEGSFQVYLARSLPSRDTPDPCRSGVFACAPGMGAKSENYASPLRSGHYPPLLRARVSSPQPQTAAVSETAAVLGVGGRLALSGEADNGHCCSDLRL